MTIVYQRMQNRRTCIWSAMRGGAVPGERVVLVAGHDLPGRCTGLVTAVLALGETPP